MKTLKDYEYFRTENGVLYCGDNMEILPLITERIDLCLTDPPYGINRDKGNVGFGGFGKPIKRKEYLDEWDNKKSNITLLLKYALILWGGNYYTDILKQGNHWIVWDKKNTMPTFSDCELAYTNIKKNSVKKYEIMQNGCMSEEKDRVHPTQKPIKLFSYILRDYSKENDLILDPFLGSGTTALACEKLNRRWIGIEISEKYCEIAKKRIEEYTKQLKLFK